MLKTGLTSVTFRNLKPVEIVELVKQAGLQGIEWGGDIHVPHGNIPCARDIYKCTTDAGLEVSSYGSYYDVGCGATPVPFETILETALALRAPIIRVWAGNRGSTAADPDWWQRVIEDSLRISELAKEVNVSLAFEYHQDTLTDTSNSTCRLLQAIDRENFLSYWQPPLDMDYESRICGLVEISQWLSNIHVFHYSENELKPLNEGETEWPNYMKILNTLPGDRYCLLEFVKENSVSQFFEDAKELLKLCKY